MDFHGPPRTSVYASYALAIVRLESLENISVKKDGYAQVPKGKIAMTTAIAMALTMTIVTVMSMATLE